MTNDEVFDIYLKKVLNGELDISTVVEEIETGIKHIEDDKYEIDERWTFNYVPNRDIVLVSEEFIKEVVGATYSVPEEWGGLIFGRVKHMKNNCTIFICERVAIMAQNRSAASFEIKDAHYQAWGLSPQYIEFIGAGYKRIGWVHSHVNMGCFWSGTDDATIRQLIAEEANSEILSLVVSKRADKKLETAYRPSNRGQRNGIEFLIPDVKITLPATQIYYEVPMLAFDELDEEYRDAMREKMKETDVIETVPTTCVSDYYTGWNEHRTYGGSTAADNCQQVDISIENFALITSGYLPTVRQLLDTKTEGSRWKMKHFVKEMALAKYSTELFTMMDFFLKTPIRVQTYLIKYRNFEDIAKSFKSHIKNLCNASSSYRDAIKERFGVAWESSFDNALIKKTYRTTTSYTTSYTPDSMRKARTDFSDYIKKIDEGILRKGIETILSVKGPLYVILAEEIIDKIEWRVRNEEDKWPLAFANTYIALKEEQNKITDEEQKKLFGEFIIEIIGEAFKPFRSKEVKTKNALQATLNHIPDEMVNDFLFDFVVDYKTEEELDELYAANRITVRRKMFGCPICNTWWSTPEDKEKCRLNCEKIAKKKAVSTLETAKSVENIPKGQAAATNIQKTPIVQTQLIDHGGKIFTPDKRKSVVISDYVCGMSLRYWQSPNVCQSCGTEYNVDTEAQLCFENCGVDEDNLVSSIIDNMGWYSCPTCEETILDPLEYYNHVTHFMCKGYGNRLHAALFNYMLSTDEKWEVHTYPKFAEDKYTEFLEFVNSIWGNKSDTVLPPPIITWILRKLKYNKSLTKCNNCEGVFEAQTEDLQNIYNCFQHEQNCVISNRMASIFDEDEEPVAAVEYSDKEKAKFVYLSQPYVNTYRCEECGALIYCTEAENFVKMLSTHYIVAHKSPVDVLVSITWEEKMEEVKNNALPVLRYQYYSYFCATPPCNGTLGFSGLSSIRNHLKTKHGIDITDEKVDFVVSITEQGTKEINEDYNSWLDGRYKTGLAINICKYCGKQFQENFKMEMNSKTCHRHEFVCEERFRNGND